MIRLLMGITLSEVGGSQKVVYGIISNLPEQVYDITLVTSPDGELLDWVRELNQHRTNKIKIITLNSIRRNLSPIYDLITLVRLIRLMKKSDYNIAHFHNSKMGTLGRIAAKICGVPRIYYTMHGLNLNINTTGRIYPILSLIEKMIARFTTKVAFVSKYDMAIGIRNGWASEANACLIYNGISEAAVPEPPQNPTKATEHVPIIAFVARLAEPKVPEFAIRVSDKLLSAGYHHELMIIGDGPKMEECRSLIRSLGIEEYVSLLGKRRNVIELLSEADIFCLFSRWEGLPISVLEAMLCELPVVASDVGGIPELIEHGKTGYLVTGLNEDLAAEYL
ncbi:MAG TPA: glycosyltransferase family 4 protein, partial [Syntrophomonas sp.]|nr:glycosyltransferase family 4 protein [Syntrophomonas sp.]